MADDEIEFLAVPGGLVILRDSRRDRVREVRLQPFRMARTPVSVRQFASSASKETVDASLAADLPQSPVTWHDAVLWCNRRSAAEGLRPAYRVSEGWVHWDTTSDGLRLPTEAEWEHACRAGTDEPTYGELSEIAWTSLDELEGPQPVALKRPNAFGLHDMIGNVWEWCWDLADPARYGAYRSLRGGGWADPVWSCRASVRRGSAPDAVIEDVGLRPVRGAVGDGSPQAQGWSDATDRERADLRGPIPFGWTPLRDIPAPEPRPGSCRTDG